MKFSINLHTIKTEGSIERLQVIISKTIAFLSLKIDFVLANRPGPDVMPIPFGSSLLPKYPF